MQRETRQQGPRWSRIVDRQSRLPSALVIKWSSQSLRVQCPYCQDSHIHEVTGSGLGTDQPLPAYCLNGERYLLVYPPIVYQGAAIGWECDEDNGIGYRYAMTRLGRLKDPADKRLPPRRLLPEYNLTNEQLSSSTDDLEQVTNNLRDVTFTEQERPRTAASQFTSPTDPIQIPIAAPNIPESRRRYFLSACGAGNVYMMAHLLKRRGFDGHQDHADTDGSTAAHKAVYATNNRCSALMLLNEYKFRLDQPDHYGRTPLMEAALWARQDAVLYLLECGASVGRVDANQMSALDLSAATRRNEEERITRAADVGHGMAADDRSRRIIHGLLTSCTPARDSTDDADSPVDDRAAVFCTNRRGQLGFYVPFWQFSRPDLSSQYPNSDPKTIAVLNRGPAYPLVSAMSGYSQGCCLNVLNSPNEPDSAIVLSNTSWTKQVEKISKVMGHTTSRKMACHAERQVLAYIVVRYGLRRAGGRPRHKEPWEPASPCFQITVSKSEPCNGFDDSCDAFIKAFRAYYKIRVEFACVGEQRLPMGN